MAGYGGAGGSGGFGAGCGGFGGFGAGRGGVDWRPPHGYSQHVAWDGEAVVKTFAPQYRVRRDAELAVLRTLQGVLPLARALPTTDPDTVRMTYVPGALGEHWVAHLGPDRTARHLRFVRQCGALLRRLHRVGPSALAGRIPGAGPVVVHGDFAPYNVIVDAENGELRAVVDWELAHLGSPVEDLAWLEWNLRIWYFPEVRVLEALYAAYGSRPAWADRHQAMIDRCRHHLEASRRPSFPPAVAQRWAAHLEQTYAFEELVPGP